MQGLFEICFLLKIKHQNFDVIIKYLLWFHYLFNFWKWSDLNVGRSYILNTPSATSNVCFYLFLIVQWTLVCQPIVLILRSPQTKVQRCHITWSRRPIHQSVSKNYFVRSLKTFIDGYTSWFFFTSDTSVSLIYVPIEREMALIAEQNSAQKSGFAKLVNRRQKRKTVRFNSGTNEIL